jgi:hypothetical protein
VREAAGIILGGIVINWISAQLTFGWGLTLTAIYIVADGWRLVSSKPFQKVVWERRKLPMSIIYLVSFLVGGSIATGLVWWYHKPQPPEPLSKQDLEKIIDNAMKRKQALEKPTEPQWMASHVYTGREVVLILFFYAWSHENTDLAAKIRCRVTAPDRNSYSWQMEMSGTGVSSLQGPNRLRYPRDFQGAPGLVPGTYHVEWLLIPHNKDMILLEDRFDIPKS